MSTPTVNHLDAVEQLPPNSTLILHGVSWGEYEELLDAVGEAKGLRISYDQGTVQVMTLSALHEAYQFLIHDLVSLLSIRQRIKVLCFGSATMKRPVKLKGVEPDLQYYVQTAAVIGNRTNLDFAVDPPDIVVEVDLQHQSFSKFPIYAAFAVPELWRYDGKSMTIYRLQDEGYVSVSSSQSIPILTGDILTEFLARVGREDQYEIVIAFEEWLRTQQV